MVPLGHRNNSAATRGNGRVWGETRSSTSAQSVGDQGGRGRDLSDPILRADATCRRCILLVRQLVQLEVGI